MFGLIEFDWNNEPSGSPVRWHTGDPDTDLWEWRMRVLQERNNIAYGKRFFRKGGFITREWCSYFLAARRGAYSFADAYVDGNVSHIARRVYDTLSGYEALPFHEIKTYDSFGRDEQSRLERALVDIKTWLYLPPPERTGYRRLVRICTDTDRRSC